MQENPHGQYASLPIFLTRQQFARETNLTTRTVSTLLKRARDGDPSGIKSVRIGGSLRIPRTEIDRLQEAAS